MKITCSIYCTQNTLFSWTQAGLNSGARIGGSKDYTFTAWVDPGFLNWGGGGGGRELCACSAQYYKNTKQIMVNQNLGGMLVTRAELHIKDYPVVQLKLLKEQFTVVFAFLVQFRILCCFEMETELRQLFLTLFNVCCVCTL